MPNRTTYVLDAVDLMLEATCRQDLASIRKTYKSDIVADAYELLTDDYKKRLHKIMEGRS